MEGARPNPKTIDEYLAHVNPDQRAALEKLRKIIRTVAPEAQECISYGIPAFRLNRCFLVAFGAWTSHCAFYPGSAPIKACRHQLENFETSKGTIRYSPEKPLPVGLVKKLVKAQMAKVMR